MNERELIEAWKKWYELPEPKIHNRVDGKDRIILPYFKGEGVWSGASFADVVSKAYEAWKKGKKGEGE